MGFSETGVSLKPSFFEEILENKPAVGWFEVHSENYMSKGGPSLAFLHRIREHYPISLHGVSLSLGGAEDLDSEHLKRLKVLVDRIDPLFVSEHLSWSRFHGTYFNDLLPLPYTDETLDLVVGHIQQTQDVLGRQIFVENPSTYMTFKDSTYDEPEFLHQMAKRSGCQLLLDVNNIYVSAKNNGFSAQDYIMALPENTPIGEIHLAGHLTRTLDNGEEFRIDDHASRVCADVWRLYEHVLAKFGACATLVEWDGAPELPVLMEEAAKAEDILKPYRESRHAANG